MWFLPALFCVSAWAVKRSGWTTSDQTFHDSFNNAAGPRNQTQFHWLIQHTLCLRITGSSPASLPRCSATSVMHSEGFVNLCYCQLKPCDCPVAFHSLSQVQECLLLTCLYNGAASYQSGWARTSCMMLLIASSEWSCSPMQSSNGLQRLYRVVKWCPAHIPLRRCCFAMDQEACC